MITIAGLGPGDPGLLSAQAESAVRIAGAANRLILRTSRHPSASALDAWGLSYTACDALYDSEPDFRAVYDRIASRVIALHDEDPAAPVCFAVPGHPLVAEESVRLILERARSRGIPTRVAPSPSFIDCALAASGEYAIAGLDVRDALDLSHDDNVDLPGTSAPARIDTSRCLLLYQIFDASSASNAKLALMREYPDDWTVHLIHHAGIPGEERVEHVPLYRLDRQPVDHLTCVLIPPLPPDARPARIEQLCGIMKRLRSPVGCPWDREQTPATIRRCLVEEAYEVIDAIDRGDTENLAEELGDVLLQVVFHAQFGAESGDFTIDDVLRTIIDKLIRRHPHVFADGAADTPDAVIRNWDRIKSAEKSAASGSSEPASAMDGVPSALPALMLAMDVSKRAVKCGFEWPALPDVFGKLQEEIDELRAEIAGEGPEERIGAELGDVLFTVVQVARWSRVDPEDALRTMVQRFTKRFRRMEVEALRSGGPFSSRSASEMDALWEQAKRAEAGQ